MTSFELPAPNKKYKNIPFSAYCPSQWNRVREEEKELWEESLTLERNGGYPIDVQTYPRNFMDLINIQIGMPEIYIRFRHNLFIITEIYCRMPGRRGLQ